MLHNSIFQVSLSGMPENSVNGEKHQTKTAPNKLAAALLPKCNHC